MKNPSTSWSGEEGRGGVERRGQVSYMQPTGTLLSSFGAIAETTFNVRTVDDRFVEFSSSFNWLGDVHVWLGKRMRVLGMRE